MDWDRQKTIVIQSKYILNQLAYDSHQNFYDSSSFLFIISFLTVLFNYLSYYHSLRFLILILLFWILFYLVFVRISHIFFINLTFPMNIFPFSTNILRKKICRILDQVYFLYCKRYVLKIKRINSYTNNSKVMKEE